VSLDLKRLKLLGKLEMQLVIFLLTTYRTEVLKLDYGKIRK